MPFKKGEIHTQGGRKTKAEEIAQAIEYKKKEITQETLITLANSKVYKQLKKSKNRKDIKEIALPITLKGMVEKKDITSKGEKIGYDDTQIKNIADRIANNGRKDSNGGTPSPEEFD